MKFRPPTLDPDGPRALLRPRVRLTPRWKPMAVGGTSWGERKGDKSQGKLGKEMGWSPNLRESLFCKMFHYEVLWAGAKGRKTPISNTS